MTNVNPFKRLWEILQSLFRKSETPVGGMSSKEFVAKYSKYSEYDL